jgi:glycosyltransferase involved in cell wall biosynthesis
LVYLPKVSIVIPIYNGEKYIEETLLSVTDSDYANYEIVVVNDGSTDRSEVICQEFLKTAGVNYQFFTKENSGEADSVNFGFSKISGEFVLILSADDKIESTLLSESVRVFIEKPEITVTYPNWNIIDHNSVVIDHVQPQDYSIDLLVGDLLCLPGPGSLIRVSAVKSGKLRDPGLRLISDFDQWLYLAIEGDFFHIGKTLASWRRHPSQQTVTGRGRPVADETIFSIKRFFAHDIIPENIKRLEKQARSMAFYRAATESLYSNQVKGRLLLLKSLATLFGRRRGAPRSRRNLTVMLAIALNPVGRALVSRRKQ